MALPPPLGKTLCFRKVIDLLPPDLLSAVFEAKHHTEGVLEGKYFNVYRTKRHTVYINATEIIIMLNNVVTSGDLKGVMHFQRKMVNGMTEMVLVKVNGS